MSSARSRAIAERAAAPAYQAEPLVGGRYRLAEAIGRGGNATVYAALDILTGERIALKRLRCHSDASASQRYAQLRREYQLLAELLHPSIIRAYDYGLDDGTPYYTMELLDGVSLAQRGPLHWREACKLLRDIASALAMIHSRKLAHRDVTLGNIHCTRAGRCKLLDFGAVARMGHVSFIVGTPPYLPPEAVRDRSVDARTDLYALGAALYYLLTGRHAYPGTRIEELESLWARRPPFPHELAPATPVLLSQLTMALLSLDPLVRPHSAAEVMDRLSALSGVELDEPGAVRRAFFARPALVGRTRALQQARLFFARSSERRGGVLAIVGPVGSGRSRLLDACVTQARLDGVTAVQVQAVNPHDAYGLVRALVREVQRTVPDWQRDASSQRLQGLLAQVVESSRTGVERGARAPRRSELQQAVDAWVLGLVGRGPLLFAVDDLDCADEPSAACLAALSEQRLSIVCSVASDRPAHAHAAVNWLVSADRRIELGALTRAEALELLSSVFGDVPNLVLLVDRVHSVAGGQPGWIMQLAEQLIESGAVRYEAGAFRIPQRFSIDELPETLTQALQLRVDQASAAARDLAHAFVLAPDAWFAADELARPLAWPIAKVESAIDELVDAGIVTRDRSGAGLRHRVWSQPDTTACVAAWRARLASLFTARGDCARSIQQLWAAGERDLAAQSLVEYSERLNEDLRRDPALLDRVIAALPVNFMGVLCEVAEAAPDLGLSRREGAMLRLTCVRLGALTSDPRALLHVRPLLAELRVHAGLEAWDRLSSIADPKQRLDRALAETQARYDAAPAADRCFSIAEAIRLLSAVNGHAVGLSSQGRDFQLYVELLSLAPLVPLSPTLAITQTLTTTVADLMAGRYELATAGYQRILEQVDGDAGAPIDAAGRRFNRFGSYYPLGLLAAGRGQVAALTWADKLERELLFEVSAWRVRLAYYRARGEVDEAERCRRQAELLRIAQRPHELYGIGAIAGELFHCVVTEDVIGIKRVLDELEIIVTSFAGWLPVLQLARGEYARMRGDNLTALSHFEAALAGCVFGQDSLWLGAAAACLSALFGLGRLERGRELGRRWFDDATAAGLGEAAHPIALWLALIEAKLGDRVRAETLAESVLCDIAELGIDGIRAGIAHETRARVAMFVGDQLSFNRHLGLCARYFQRGRCWALRARYERIVRDARALGVCDEAPSEGGHEGAIEQACAALELRFRACSSAPERAELVLLVIGHESGAQAGALYLAQRGGMMLAAVFGGWVVSEQLDRWVDRMQPNDGHGSRERDSIDSGQDETREAQLSLGLCEHRAYLLAEVSEAKDGPTGIVLLRDADRVEPPSNVLLELCARLLAEAGDTSRV